MVNLSATDPQDPHADVIIHPPSRIGRRVRYLVGLVVVVALAAVVVWQFVDLRQQLHQVRRTNDGQSQQLQQLQKNLSNLQNGITAAVGCLESPNPEKALCSQFLR